MPEGSQPAYEIALAHFIVSDDVERSRRFYTEVLGGKTIRSGEPTYVALANSWIIINLGGGPTDDKPAVTLETPRDADLASSFLNIRVSDIHAVYAEWSARGAEFLTPLGQHDLTSGLVVAQVAGEQAGTAAAVAGRCVSAAAVLMTLTVCGLLLAVLPGTRPRLELPTSARRPLSTSRRSERVSLSSRGGVSRGCVWPRCA